MKEKFAIVTGGANGIGRCITETFISEGYRVAVIDVDDVSGSKLSKRHGEDRLIFFKGNVSEKDDLDRFVDAVLSRRDAVDVLVNNACITRGGLETCSYEDFNYVLRVGVSAPFYLAKKLSAHFSKGASIINIASTRAFMSQPNTESYTAAKGGISALTHAMSVTLAGKVRVNSISPGWIDTGAYQHEENYLPSYTEGDTAQHSAGRVGRPEDIARAVLFLSSEDAGFITGENITIDGGMTKLMIYHNDHGWTYDAKQR